MLLNLIVACSSADLIARALDAVPCTFDIHSVVEWKLFVNHTNGMVDPHVAKPILSQVTHRPSVIHVTHVTITKDH